MRGEPDSHGAITVKSHAPRWNARCECATDMLRIAVVFMIGCTPAASSTIDADRCPTAEPANQSTCTIEALGCTYGRTYCQCDEFQGANGTTWGCTVSSCPTDVGCAD